MNYYNSWVEISRSALVNNLRLYRIIIGKKTKIMAIVKSNAYGHGMAEVAKAVEKKVDWFGVVNVDEALALRKNEIKKPILVLSYYDKKKIKEAIRKNISLVVYDLAQAKEISWVAKKIRKQAKIHLKVDTGASRLGVLSNKFVQFARAIRKIPNLSIEGIFSHFAASEENQKYTEKQLEKFNRLQDELEKLGIKIPLKHFACSAATLVKKESHFNLVRLGLSLYGLWPSPETKKMILKKYPWFQLKPALAWKTKVIQVKELPKNTYVGYGCTYRTKKKTKIAILPVGYFEGYDRHLGNQGEVIIRGKKCGVIGRICMNLTIVDVTGVKQVKAGDEAVLLGRVGRLEVTADDLARKVGTINYEIVTRIDPNLERRYN